jgi:hypothetical protein
MEEGTVYHFDPTESRRVKYPNTGETGWLQEDGSI